MRSQPLPYPAPSQVFLFLITNVILLTNMLIAMMNDSYNENKENAVRNYKLILTWDTILHRARVSWQAPPPLNLLLLPNKLFRQARKYYERFRGEEHVDYKKVDDGRKKTVQELLDKARLTWLELVEKAKKVEKAKNE